MAYVPGSHYDVFISYARRSDMADWVSRFRTELETQLCSRLGGREASVWMDSRLIVGDDFAEKIQSKLRNTALLLAVISPRYVESDPCMVMELRFFHSGGSGEVIQILKTPLNEPEQRMPFPNLEYAKFYELKDWGPDEFEPGEPRFSRLVKQVAEQVKARLVDMRRKRQKVYLTYLDPVNTDVTLRRHREELLNEFEDRGYATLPSQVIAEDDTDFTRWNLEQSHVLIYLPNGTLEEKQFRIARELQKPVVTCSLRPLPSFDNGAELPVILGTPDWKREVVLRVENKLTSKARSSIA